MVQRSRGKFLTFQFLRMSKGGKTGIWEVANPDGVVVGFIGWHAPWRRYCFSAGTEGHYIFDATCLTDVAEFLDGLMKIHHNVGVLSHAG